jgi:DNA replication and repair protein RecF
VFYRNGKRQARAPHLNDAYPVFAFVPDDRLLVKSEPRLRRSFFDEFIRHLDPEYDRLSGAYASYTRLRRTARCRGEKENGIMAERWLDSASRLIAKRIHYIRSQNEQLSACGFSDLVIGYATTAGAIVSDDAGVMRRDLEQRCIETEGREYSQRRILVGPHLDDYRFFYRGRDARFYCSQGETRMLVFFLKFAQAALMEKSCGRPPILLIDEFLDTFDHEAIRFLTAGFPRAQSFFTSCRREILDFLPDARVFEL